MRRPPSPPCEYRHARGSAYPLPMRYLRQPIARRIRSTAARMAADPRRRHGFAVGHGHRTRTGMAGPIRVSVEAPPRLRHVCVVRAGNRRAAGRARLRDTSVLALREPSRWHPSARREKDATHGTGPTGAPIPTRRDVRDRSPPRRGRSIALRAIVDGGPTLLPFDQRRAGLRSRRPRRTERDRRLPLVPRLAEASAAGLQRMN